MGDKNCGGGAKIGRVVTLTVDRISRVVIESPVGNVEHPAPLLALRKDVVHAGAIAVMGHGITVDIGIPQYQCRGHNVPTTREIELVAEFQAVEITVAIEQIALSRAKTKPWPLRSLSISMLLLEY